MALAPEEAQLIESASINRLAPADFAVIAEELDDGSTGAISLMLIVEAGSVAGAVPAIDAEWAKLRAAAHPPPTIAALEFVVGPVDGSAPLHDVQLGRARQLLDSGSTSYATVAAQTALEMYARGLLCDLSKANWGVDIVDVLHLQAVSLRQPNQRALAKALIGKDPASAGGPWDDYGAHLRRRNGVVHDGAFVNAEGAAASIQAVRNMITWLEDTAATA
jgi:hypothetical protein